MSERPSHPAALMKTRTFTATMPGGLLLDLRMTAGTISVIVEDREHAEVILTGPPDSPAAESIDRTQFTESGQRLTVRVPDPPTQHISGSVHVSGGNSGVMVIGVGNVVMHGHIHGGMVIGNLGTTGVDVEIRLPRNSSLLAETISAPITCTGGLRGADVKTISGAIRLEAVAGPRLRSTSGSVHVADLIGTGSIETVSGDIDVTATVPSELTAKSVSGDIRVSGPIRLAAHTVSGRVRTY